MSDKEKTRATRMWKKGAAKFLSDLHLAQDRLGDTFESRLRWLLDFKDQDLTKLASGERRMLSIGLKLLPPMMYTKVSTPPPVTVMTDLPDATLTDIQEWTRELFDTLFSAQKKLFEIEPPTKIQIFRASGLDAKHTQMQVMNRFISQDERLPIKHGIVNLIAFGADHLRACRECHKPFLVSRKKEYCSPACSQKARDRRRPKKK